MDGDASRRSQADGIRAILKREKDQITFFNRSDFIGVLSAEYLPDWAKEKLAAMDATEAEETPSDGMTLQ